MKLKAICVFTIACIIFAGCASSHSNNNKTKNELAAVDVKPYGRYWIDKQQNLELISSAVHFGFDFTGSSCTIYAFINDAGGHNYLQYELDGVYQKRLKVEGNTVQPITINAGASGTHTVWIYKATEAATGPIIIQKIIADNIKAITTFN